jgi:hypothetical protein
VALQVGRLKIPWPGKDSHADDPYWDFFINAPPADLANTITEMIRHAPQGNIFPTKAELHTPEITSSHVKEMARYLGADLVGIVNLDAQHLIEGCPFGIVCGVGAEYDPKQAPGIGGQVPVQNGLFITFVLSAWIRELGFCATATPHPYAESLAAAAGLGRLDGSGRLVTSKYGTRVHVADLIHTDLPLAADG